MSFFFYFVSLHVFFFFFWQISNHYCGRFDVIFKRKNLEKGFLVRIKKFVEKKNAFM